MAPQPQQPEASVLVLRCSGPGPDGAATIQYLEFTRRRSPERAEHPFDCAALTGLEFHLILDPRPRRCPGLVSGYPFGVSKSRNIKERERGLPNSASTMGPRPAPSLTLWVCIPSAARAAIWLGYPPRDCNRLQYAAILAPTTGVSGRTRCSALGTGGLSTAD